MTYAWYVIRVLHKPTKYIEHMASNPIPLSQRYKYLDKQLIKKYIVGLFIESGFFIAENEYNSFMDNQKRCGSEIIEKELPHFMKSYNPDAFGLYDSILSKRPDLGRKIVHTAAFGHGFGSLLHGLRMEEETGHDDVYLAAAVFNTGIAMFDHIIDETGYGATVFDQVNEHTLKKVKNNGYRPIIGKNEAFGCIDDIVKLLFVLVDTFFFIIQSIYSRSKNDSIWHQLCDEIIDLFISEKHASGSTFCADGNESGRIDSFKRKSVLPFDVIFLVSALCDRSQHAQRSSIVREMCLVAGTIFWIADDLADVVGDLSRNFPGYVTARMIGFRGGQSAPVSLKTAVHDSVEDLFGYFAEFDEYRNRDCINKKLFDTLSDFIKMYVYSWIIE